MMNMSYCCFENTYRALKECFDVMDDDLSSKEEQQYRMKLLKLCANLAYDYEDEIEELAYDKSNMITLCKECHKEKHKLGAGESMKFHKPDYKIDYYDNYEAAMSRRRPDSVLEYDRFYDYLYNRGDIRVYQESKVQKTSAVIGQLSETALDGEKFEILEVSHFSPGSMRGGVNLLRKMSKVRDRVIVFAVTDDLTDMLIGCGFSPVGVSFQMFWNGNEQTKYVLTQRGFESIVKSLIKKGQSEAV